jgi:hypothetical protein
MKTYLCLRDYFGMTSGGTSNLCLAQIRLYLMGDGLIARYKWLLAYCS